MTSEAIQFKLDRNPPSVVCSSIEWSVIPTIDWDRNSGTGNNGPIMNIYGNVLQPGSNYLVQVHGELTVYIEQKG